ncbi:hypothetical protein CAPN004_12410 [Capnocytophaga cynodegmi]|uniref:DUF4276 family protein n=1 Tax=Capnocytophaga cynodegmi TaxID=28189 RepID=UPI001AC9F9B9|nr:DUF4276 family protein [Capnocytophaga cynodegmi]GIM52211.1 hypothetical protein CAPN004_12410 [Capnocytophaga cynodegmi]
MKRIIIICEGQTEQEFVRKIMYPFFIGKNIMLDAPLIKHSRGGMVDWQLLKKQIENHLRQDKNSIVSTFIDYYGLHSGHKFPNWEQSQQITDKNQRITYLEKQMKLAISEELQHRFIPYMQLHEFEGLLFCKKDIFLQVIPTNELIDKDELDYIFANFDNPEMINDKKETSPSHRLQRIIKGYDKVVYGNIIAETTGLHCIRNKAPRFNNWIGILSEYEVTN